MKKIILTAALISTVFLTTLFLYFYQGTLIITVNQNADILLNGEIIGNGGTIKKKVWPKEYTITIKKEGFEEQSKIIRVQPFEEDEINIELLASVEMWLPDSLGWSYQDGHFYYYEQNSRSLYKKSLEGETFPIKEHLPFFAKGVVWSPDKKSALLFSEEKNGELYIWANDKIIKTESLYYEVASWNNNSQQFIVVDLIDDKPYLINLDGSRTAIDYDVLLPSILNWDSKNYRLLYSRAEIDQVEPVFEIIDLKNIKSVLKTSEVVQNSFLAEHGYAITLTKSFSNKNKAINHINAENQKKILYEGNEIIDIKYANNLIYVLEENKILTMKTDGTINKTYQAIIGQKKIDNFVIIKNSLYFDLNNSIYKLILVEK